MNNVKIKIIEIRDRATYIAVMAIRMRPDDDVERAYLRRAGYGREDKSNCVMLVGLEGGRIATSNAYNHGDRTMHNAHLFIEKHYDNLESGDVVDVEYVLGETEKPKRTERFSW